MMGSIKHHNKCEREKNEYSFMLRSRQCHKIENYYIKIKEFRVFISLLRSSVFGLKMITWHCCIFHGNGCNEYDHGWCWVDDPKQQNDIMFNVARWHKTVRVSSACLVLHF